MFFLRKLSAIAQTIVSAEKWVKFDSKSDVQGWKRSKEDGGYEYRYQDSDPNVKTNKVENEVKGLKQLESYQEGLFDNIISIERLGGSTGALKVDNGKSQYVVKTYENNGGINQIKNELLANKLYDLLGISVPNTSVSEFKGKPALVTEFIEGDHGLQRSNFENGFIGDAWLSNWDSLGLEEDNVINVGFKTIRIDNGGALLFRAQGQPKGENFGDAVPELETLRDPEINPSSANGFRDITDEKILIQIRKLLKTSDARIFLAVSKVYNTPEEKEFADKLTERLIKRKNYILEYGKLLAVKKIQDNALKRKERYIIGQQQDRSGITQKDASVIRDYTSVGYKNTNEYLRGNLEDDKEIANGKEKAEWLVSALRKLPAFKGTVYRGSKLDGDSLLAMATMKPGDLIYMKAFTSSSKSKSVIDNFGETVRFEIETTTGRDVSYLSKFAWEEEVVLSPDTRYEVVSVATNVPVSEYGDVTLSVKMKEVPADKKLNKLPYNMKKHQPTASELQNFLLKNPKLTPKQREYILHLGVEDLQKMVVAMFSKGKKSVNSPEPDSSEQKFTEIFI